MYPVCTVFYKGSIALYTPIELLLISSGATDIPSLSKANGEEKKHQPFRCYLKVGKSLSARGNSAWANSLGLELQLPENLVSMKTYIY